MPSMLSERFTDALTYATDLHSSQVRRGTDTPYIAHLLGVCSLVLEDGGDEDEAIAALLHDAVEDQDEGSPEELMEEIRSRYGDNVAAIVDACTETLGRPKPPWVARRAIYLAELEHASDSALRVSLADKLYNARAILRDYRVHGDELWSRFNKESNKDLQLKYYSDLAEVFGRRSASPMANELGRVVAELVSIS